MESGRQDGTAGRGRYSGIPLNLLRRYRTTLSRQADAAGTTSWTARVVGIPGCEGTGSSRTEALHRVREMASSNGPMRLSAVGLDVGE